MNLTNPKIFSYDIVGDPPLSNARFQTLEELDKIQKELQRQKLLKSRIEKLNKLNDL